MLNDANREDIQEFFLNKIASDPRLAALENDIVTIALSNEMGYKVDKVLNRYTSQLSEHYEPTKEVILLSKLMYELGYLRLQKPLVVSSDIKSGVDVILEKYQRFSNGINVFMLDESVTLQAGVAQNLSLTMGTKREITTTVSNDNYYYKIPLQTSYRKLYDFNVYRGDTLLNYSQAFISEYSDVSLEVDIFGNMIVVVRTGNVNGNNILINDVLRLEIFESEYSDETPDNLGIIGDFDIICLNVLRKDRYEPFLSIAQMQDILKYNKNINNSVVYNENYENLIRAHVRGINLIKVWQQEDEDNENGADQCNINKVFCSYIPIDNGTNIDDEITTLISETVYGKQIVIRDPNIIGITIDIAIVNNTKKSISTVLQEEVKAKLSGYYDNKERRLTNAIVYRDIIETLVGHNIDVELSISSLGDQLNADFYLVDTANINITVSERV